MTVYGSFKAPVDGGVGGTYRDADQQAEADRGARGLDDHSPNPESGRNMHSLCYSNRVIDLPSIVERRTTVDFVSLLDAFNGLHQQVYMGRILRNLILHVSPRRSYFRFLPAAFKSLHLLDEDVQ